MPLELPNLDDRTYQDLLEEAIAQIPTFAPEWTNYNPSDPGIATIEMFAYLAEMQIYRLNRVTDKNLRSFLKLLNGEDWVSTQDLSEEIRQAVLRLRSRNRAVTREDYERLSTENFNSWLAETGQLQGVEKVEGTEEAVGRIQRAYCIVDRNLEKNVEEERQQAAPGHVSVVIVPSEGAIEPNEIGLQPTEKQRELLWKYLNDRRILTTRHHVVGPTYVPISADIQVVRRHDALDEELRDRIVQAIEDFLSPLPNNSNPQGWPFGRNVYVSELYELLEQVEGIDYIPNIQLSSECPAESDRCVAAQPIFNNEEEQIGLQLYDHHLPAAHLDPTKIQISIGGESNAN
jgi:cobalamin biosynthesis Mg chelatase CobN